MLDKTLARMIIEEFDVNQILDYCEENGLLDELALSEYRKHSIKPYIYHQCREFLFSPEVEHLISLNPVNFYVRLKEIYRDCNKMYLYVCDQLWGDLFFRGMSYLVEGKPQVKLCFTPHNIEKFNKVFKHLKDKKMLREISDYKWRSKLRHKKAY